MLDVIIGLIVGTILTVLLIRGLAFLVKYSEQWARDGKPKVWPRPTRCPRCELTIGRFKTLRTLRNLLLGGWTCPGCGSEFDQLDNVRIARAWNAHITDFRERSRRSAELEASQDDRSPVQQLLDE